MPLNITHKSIVSLTLDKYFKDVPESEEAFKHYVNELILAVTDHKKNAHYPLVKLFENPENFYNLQVIDPLTKGDVRLFVLEDIDRRLKEIALRLGIDLSGLHWNLTTFQEETKLKKDNGDNLICQSKEFPEGVTSASFLQAIEQRRGQMIGQEIRKGIHFDKNENAPESPEGFTFEDIQLYSEKLFITDPTYIHAVIDAVEDNYIPNYLNIGPLKEVAEMLPKDYLKLKQYFIELYNKLKTDEYDVADNDDVGLPFFHGTDTARIALALALAIAKKDNIPAINSQITIIISDLQIQDKIKEAFTKYIKLDPKKADEIQNRLGLVEKMEKLTLFNVNKNKVISVLKYIEKSDDLNLSNTGKLLFERLTIAELDNLSKKINKSKNIDDNKKQEILKFINQRKNNINSDFKNNNNNI